MFVMPLMFVFEIEKKAATFYFLGGIRSSFGFICHCPYIIIDNLVDHFTRYKRYNYNIFSYAQ